MALRHAKKGDIRLTVVSGLNTNNLVGSSPLLLANDVLRAHIVDWVVVIRGTQADQ